MTLVAAFQVDNVPILVGDTRVTGREQSTLAKKIYRFGPNFVVAWAGSQVVANLVLKELYKRLHGSWVRKENVEDVLTSFSAEDFGASNAHLIGWIVDEESRCFRWNSGYPKELFYDSHHIDGTGEQYFLNLLTAKRPGGGRGEGPQYSVLVALNAVNEAITQEVLNPDDWDKSFGFCYELLYFHRGSFAYVDSVTFFMSNYHWDETTKTGEVELGPIISKYTNLSECAIFQRMEFDQTNRVVELVNYPITPTFDPMRHMDLSGMPQELASEFYANYVIFRGTKENFQVALVARAGSPDQPISINPRDGTIHMPPEFFNHLYHRHRHSTAQLIGNNNVASIRQYQLASQLNYLIGGNLCNAFTLGEVGSQDDFFLVGSEESENGFHAVITGNILDSSGQVAIRIVRNVVVYSRNPGGGKLLRSHWGYDLLDGAGRVLFGVRTYEEVLPGLGDQSRNVIVVKGDFYDKSGRLVFRGNFGEVGEFVPDYVKATFGYRDNKFGAVQNMNQRDMDIAGVIMQSKSAVHELLSGKVESEDVSLDGKILCDAEISHCRISIRTGQFAMIGKDSLKDNKIFFSGPASNIHRLIKQNKE